MTQGAPKDTDIIDIDVDSMLVQRFSKPATVKFAGRNWKLRRDLTPEEVVEFWKYSSDSKNVEAWAMLLGNEDDAKALNEGLQALPMPVFVNTVQKIYRKLGFSLDVSDVEARSKDGGSGNSSAS
jgi:hypothetical protein